MPDVEFVLLDRIVLALAEAADQAEPNSIADRLSGPELARRLNLPLRDVLREIVLHLGTTQTETRHRYIYRSDRPHVLYWLTDAGRDHVGDLEIQRDVF